MSGMCRKCCVGRSGDKIGDACMTEGCNGFIQEDQNIRDVTDELPEPMTCGRREEMGLGAGMADRFTLAGDGLDRWLKHKTNGDRTCNFCGSLHFEDFTRLVAVAAAAPEDAPYRSVVEIEPSDKNYKVYVYQPGVRNASEGGIKFYMQHVPRKADGSVDVTAEHHAQFHEAAVRSQARFNRLLEETRKRGPHIPE